ncbi:segregation and condensation protein A [Boudabousia marimammalium]|uniref:Segregation and condensation protein A n=1 Tax=Boudabousia marimammalium TaxID=156892 RepID=A0A1Q5PQQ8_9ACTO|nr:ScpA family protein [Boudabousia marimammalium]OKL49978.1 hypothetical protein BM477_03525 [Boudabousia marimammalium]
MDGEKSHLPQTFEVHLDNFSGPFDLLLSLIAKRKLDLTELALSAVTEEFIAYMDKVTDFSQTSEFLVVAATLLDAKAARLLPVDEQTDDDTLAALEAADVLFSHLLQYRAFKQATEFLAQRFATWSQSTPRAVPLEERYERILPPIKINIDVRRLANYAWDAFHQPEPQVETRHVHSATVSVSSQVDTILAKLRRSRSCTFTQLQEEAPTLGHAVALFLAVLLLYRDRVIEVKQPEVLGELLITRNDDRIKNYSGSEAVA